MAGVDYLASFDASRDVFMRILALTDEENRSHILNLMVPGQTFFSKRPIYASLDTVVGEPTRGQHDVFIPFVVVNVDALDEELFTQMEALAEDHEGN